MVQKALGKVPQGRGTLTIFNHFVKFLIINLREFPTCKIILR